MRGLPAQAGDRLHHVMRHAVDEAQRLRAVAGDRHRQSAHLQRRNDRPDDLGIIVDEEDGRGHSRCSLAAEGSPRTPSGDGAVSITKA